MLGRHSIVVLIFESLMEIKERTNLAWLLCLITLAFISQCIFPFSYHNHNYEKPEAVCCCLRQTGARQVSKRDRK